MHNSIPHHLHTQFSHPIQHHPPRPQPLYPPNQQPSQQQQHLQHLQHFQLGLQPPRHPNLPNNHPQPPNHHQQQQQQQPQPQPQPQPQQNGLQPLPFQSNLRDMDPDRLLLIYMIDLCNKKNWHDSAAALRRDAKLAEQEQEAVDSQHGFLSEWWIAFWDLYAARSNRTKNPVAASYHNMVRGLGRGGQPANARILDALPAPPTQPGFPQHHPHMNGVAVGGVHPAQPAIPQQPGQQHPPQPGGPSRPPNPLQVPGPAHLGGQRHLGMPNGVVAIPPSASPRPGRPGPGGPPMAMPSAMLVRSGVPQPLQQQQQQQHGVPQTPQLGQPPASPQKDVWTSLFFEFTALPPSEQAAIMAAAGFPDRQPTSLVSETDKLQWKLAWDRAKSMPPPPVPHRQTQTPHQTAVNVQGMPTASVTRPGKRRSQDEVEDNQDKDGSPSSRKKPRTGGAPQTPGAQNLNVNRTPTASSSTMAPPPTPILQQGQRGPPGGGQQQRQPGHQTPQGQPPSTPQMQNRYMPGPPGMGVGGAVGPGQQRPGTTGGPLGTMPSLAYPNPSVMNGARVSLSGGAGVPAVGAGVGGPSSMPMIPNTGPIGNQLQAAARTASNVQQIQSVNKPGAGQFAFPAMTPGYSQPQPAMPGQPGGQQQQPGQPPMHGGVPNNPFPTGPAQATVSNVKAPMLPPPKAPGSAKPAHRTVPGGPGTGSGPGVVGTKKEGASPNLETKDTKDGIKRSPASRSASQPSKPGAGAATPSANTGLQPGGPVSGGGALSPGPLMAQQQHQQRQSQVQATVNQSPSLLGGAVAGGMLNGLGPGPGPGGAPSSNPGATVNPSATLPFADLDFVFNQMPGMGDLFTNDFSFTGLESMGRPGLGSGTDHDFMNFLNIGESMDGNNMLR